MNPTVYVDPSGERNEERSAEYKWTDEDDIPNGTTYHVVERGGKTTFYSANPADWPNDDPAGFRITERLSQEERTKQSLLGRLRAGWDDLVERRLGALRDKAAELRQSLGSALEKNPVDLENYEEQRKDQFDSIRIVAEDSKEAGVEFVAATGETALDVSGAIGGGKIAKSITSGIGKENLGEGGRVLVLRREEGLDPDDFRRKAMALQDLARRGKLQRAPSPVTRDPKLGAQYKNRLIRRAYAQYGNEDPERFRSLRKRILNLDADHIHELQLSGADDATNLWLLDRKVNNRIGGQVRSQVRNDPPGTPIVDVVIDER